MGFFQEAGKRIREEIARGVQIELNQITVDTLEQTQALFARIQQQITPEIQTAIEARTGTTGNRHELLVAAIAMGYMSRTVEGHPDNNQQANNLFLLRLPGLLKSSPEIAGIIAHKVIPSLEHWNPQLDGKFNLARVSYMMAQGFAAGRNLYSITHDTNPLITRDGIAKQLAAPRLPFRRARTV